MIVVAAALVAPDGRVLVQQRPYGKQAGGLWEFPGGKCEVGEAWADALVRELDEELAITVRAADCVPVSFAADRLDDGRDMVMALFLCRQWGGVMDVRAARAAQWVEPANLAQLPMPPVDMALIGALHRLIAAGDLG
ncbi:MAG: (deoxy)nucleoside triphosphate pyrophosphohydrolase [Sphingopyxis sp.]